MSDPTAEYIEKLRVACYKIDTEGLDYALTDGGWVKAEGFRGDDPLLADVIAHAVTAIEDLKVVLAERRDEYGIEDS